MMKVRKTRTAVIDINIIYIRSAGITLFHWSLTVFYTKQNNIEEEKRKPNLI